MPFSSVQVGWRDGAVEEPTFPMRGKAPDRGSGADEGGHV
jgi:hypothetical protein